MGSIIEKYKTYNKKKSYASISFSGFLSKGTNGSILFSDAFNDTIYLLPANNNTIIPKYYVNFGKSSHNKIKEDHRKILEKQNLFNEKKAFLGAKCYFNNTYLVFSYQHGRTVKHCIYNHKNKKVYSIDKDCADGLIALWSDIQYLSPNNELYVSVPTSTVSYLKQEKSLYDDLKIKWPTLYPVLNKENLFEYYILKIKLKDT